MGSHEDLQEDILQNVLTTLEETGYNGITSHTQLRDKN